MVIVWSKNAKDDLSNYMQTSKIVTEGKIENYISSLIDYVNTLENFHKLGKFLFNRGDFEIRQLIYNQHKIFYAIHNNEIHILHVYHSSKNIDKNKLNIKN